MTPNARNALIVVCCVHVHVHVRVHAREHARVHARVHACAISIVSPLVSSRQKGGRRTRSNLIRSLSKSKLNPEPAIGF